ncbi:hybrid sensor histidine kinase/response regulator [Aliterella atlantica]|uniref:Chemotaxis protein CheY n=1 Tax=Aliterella atlantica CENA595 TaxID=1618023 RepID=A0A0D8ZX32_9CYAN|nr:response regulator [Aliterella atlantica]KJH73323.1 chemotaxis protein CheY [Aliterella atlantica CENA595]
MSKILVIEDEFLIRENLLERLGAEGFDTLGAENGSDGIKLAIADKPDLIICDVMMPEVDGYEVLKTLRQNPNTAAVPFIFLTAKADKAALRQGMELGADDYLTKPFTKTELLGAVATRLEKHAVVAQHFEEELVGFVQGITDVLPEELLNPVYQIFSLTQKLVEEHEEIQPQEILATAENINGATMYLHRLMENFVIYSKLKALTINSQEVEILNDCRTSNPNEIVASVARQKATQYNREADLRVNVARAGVKIAEHDLKKIVEEIVDNAFKFSETGTFVDIKATIEDDIYFLTIANSGCSMTLEQIASIGACRQFEREFYEQQGLGLGLIIAKRLCELHNGQLTIKTAKNAPTTTVCIEFKCA